MVVQYRGNAGGRLKGRAATATKNKNVTRRRNPNESKRRVKRLRNVLATCTENVTLSPARHVRTLFGPSLRPPLPPRTVPAGLLSLARHRTTLRNNGSAPFATSRRPADFGRNDNYRPETPPDVSVSASGPVRLPIPSKARPHRIQVRKPAGTDVSVPQ
uniref:Uncharacterized protein n=1 Tax=Sipha flava TaxID=143950 RepID=A0A2S2QEP9_9HEMI